MTESAGLPDRQPPLPRIGSATSAEIEECTEWFRSWCRATLTLFAMGPIRRQSLLHSMPWATAPYGGAPALCPEWGP